MDKDLRQTENYSEYIKSIGWGVKRVNGVYCYVKKIPFLTIVKIQRPKSLIVNSLVRYLVNKYRYSIIYVELSTVKQFSSLVKIGFKKYSSPFLPTKSIQIDLKKSESILLSEMHPKTRYNVKHAEKLGVKVGISNDIKKFASFWQKTSLSWGMFLPEVKNIKSIYSAFGDEAKIFIARKNGRILGGILLISTKDTSYYMYAAYSDEGKKLFAPTLLVWEAIKYAKKNGKKIFDFEGIYDGRYPLKTWSGFSRFKKSFGGRVVEYPGPLVRSNLPFGITF